LRSTIRSSTITYLKPGISFGICRDDNVRLWRSKLSPDNNALMPVFSVLFLSLFFSLTHIISVLVVVVVEISYTRLFSTHCTSISFHHNIIISSIIISNKLILHTPYKVRFIFKTDDIPTLKTILKKIAGHRSPYRMY